ncbi:MAG: secretin N-terminal domain-containing protein [Pseudomonadota bacterium]
MQRCLFVLLLMSASALAFAQDSVEVIVLKYRTAEQLIPLVQPLVGRDGAVTGMQNKLIVRTTASRMKDVKQVIASLDTQPRKLMITVRQNVAREALEQEASVYGTAGGSRGRVTLPETTTEGGVQVEAGGGRNRVGGKIVSTRDLEDSRDTQRIQVLEGNQAFIRAGQSVPYTTQTVVQNGRQVTVTEGTTYRDVTSGFYVVPRVSGEQVTLEINPQRNTVGAGGAVNIQQAATTLSGRLGEWIELGGVGGQSTSSGSGTVYSTRSVSSDNRTIFVKVEEVK